MTQTTASILVVDENADERAPFVAGLHGQGFSVDFARSGDEALQSISKGDFDLVLLDAKVPPLGGFGVLRSIRAQHGALLLPVILILECDDVEQAVAALDAGADDYIARPIDCSLLQARTRARLMRIRAARDLECVTQTLEATVQKKLSVSLVRDAHGDPLHFVAQILDLTERKAAEAQLLQAQKMQALGRLTGGVAHDFNNLLTVILGNARLLERRLADDPVVNRQTAAIVDAAKRGANLTQRLLVFSRRGRLEPKAVDGKKLVCRLLDLLRAALGETIQIETHFGNGEFIVFVDPNQLETAVLNLATNARDAMPDGGLLTISLETVVVDEHASELACRLTPGAYIMLSVKDSGCGIPAAELDQIFEPFFTTKEVGKGTGLGLSMVFGFAQQSGGTMEVDSQVRRGTTFRLYLPRSDMPAQSYDVVDGAETVDAGGRESIMVVEDEPNVRRLAVTWLTDRGYRVMEAEDGPEALNKLEQHPDIDLLFTDIVMPGGMTGYELAERARRYISELKILFTSGYALAAANRGPERRKEAPIVVKPYDEPELSRSIRQLLDTPS